jgi:hypothetical protein
VTKQGPKLRIEVRYSASGTVRLTELKLPAAAKPPGKKASTHA